MSENKDTQMVIDAEIIEEQQAPAMEPPPLQQDKVFQVVTVDCITQSCRDRIESYIAENMQSVTTTIDASQPMILICCNIRASQIETLKKLKALYTRGHAVTACIEKAADFVTTAGAFAANNVVTPALKGCIKLTGGLARVGVTTVGKTAATAYNTTITTTVDVVNDMRCDEEVTAAVANTKKAYNGAKSWLSKIIKKEDESIKILDNQQINI